MLDLGIPTQVDKGKMSSTRTWVACLGVLAIAATAAAFSPHSAVSLRSMLRPAAMSIRRRGLVSTTMQARDKLTGEKFEETVGWFTFPYSGSVPNVAS